MNKVKIDRNEYIKTTFICPSYFGKVSFNIKN